MSMGHGFSRMGTDQAPIRGIPTARNAVSVFIRENPWQKTAARRKPGGGLY